MTDPVDPHHRRRTAFDKDDGKTGQGYTLDDERRMASDMPAGSVAPKPSVLPPDHGDSGRRASFDPVTGEVRGSGSGAGGGHDGEDPDSDSAGGDGPPRTGADVPGNG
ncbi:hypothetical protein [Sphingomonas endophytica]|uniref:Uncharacterized protein n=1 Tax=Sphingomonas endophytica TaxID=869719 RepID=A0A147I6R1_9SPHN|nr:hypothetical protein [Sphingomonas endophytica]KTT74611.1 hypothetical protein NS334_04250 [Sphingomonas endophytica]